ncbi:MAG: FIST C-terminal domain-containing protein, partial [Sulfurovaceae bacterium]|nr:FIST C-terminal domain-containing protein [Sulfurovaceae bacterium]
IKDFDDTDDLLKISEDVVHGLSKEGLKHIFLLSDGLNMNGSFLAQGANSAVASKIAITGGLAGDGTNFQETWVIANDVAKQNRVVAIGFYGESLTIESGCAGGWNEFGMLRKITKSTNNIVYEIDGKPALELYKKYLGNYAKELEEGSALNFPMNIRTNRDDIPITRSVLSVDEETQSLVFAGDVPTGSFAKLMRTSVNDLIDGSETAAKQIRKINNNTSLGLVVSCIGRRFVLKQLTDDELEVIKDTLGESINLVGFYSYGELAPFSNELLSCKLHNQTMTLTVIYED